jgi:hypothetical protein
MQRPSRSLLALGRVHASRGENPDSKQLREVTYMRPDRPLIASILLLAAGLGLTFVYCHGNVGMAASYPLSGALLKIDLATYGPAALGGPALTVVGLAALLWALICAIFSQIGLLFGRADDGPTRLFDSTRDRDDSGPTRLFGSVMERDADERPPRFGKLAADPPEGSAPQLLGRPLNHS